jgi:four helix bundle protein
MRDFKTLAVWQKGHQLTLDVYQSTERFPKEELYGLTSQIRRACASIPMNIAEGCGHSGDPEFAHFLSIAMGSASELEYQLLLTRDLGLLSQSDYDRLEPALIEVKRMLNSFIQKLKAKS